MKLYNNDEWMHFILIIYFFFFLKISLYTRIILNTSRNAYWTNEFQLLLLFSFKVNISDDKPSIWVYHGYKTMLLEY